MNEKKQVVVWDSFIRVFHWSLLLLFFVAYLTGDDKGPLHRYVGYAVLLLVIARICWGFWGTKHALFSDFICSPAKGLNYLKELVTGKTNTLYRSQSRSRLDDSFVTFKQHNNLSDWLCGAHDQERTEFNRFWQYNFDCWKRLRR